MTATTFQSINPADLSILAQYPSIDRQQLDVRIEAAAEAALTWRTTQFEDRAAIMQRLALVLREHVDRIARTVTLEMGKPLHESQAEVLKCAIACEYYAQHASAYLAPQHIGTESSQSFVRHDPLGIVLAIMPWNFPIWQVIRCAVPAITAGNTVLLKHAPNVLGCAHALVQAMYEAGVPQHVMQIIEIHHDDVEIVVAHPAVQAISLTGSERAGISVASLAGKHLKKCVLELGGSNAFVVWSDANLQAAVEIAVASRMGNSGQSCIAAKRFIVHQDIAHQFTAALTERVGQLVVGDPLDTSTQVGPLARVDLAEHLEQQLTDSIAAGAKVLVGGSRRGAWFDPTVVTNVRPGMRVFDEETFGPLACITIADTDDHAMTLAMHTPYGLGMSVFTQDVDRALDYAPIVPDGYLAINAMVKSDARLPFGGTHRSGYGRELSRDGLMEFVNRKTVVVQ